MAMESPRLMTKLDVLRESGLECEVQCNPKTGEVTDLFITINGAYEEHEVGHIELKDFISLVNAFKTLQRVL